MLEHNTYPVIFDVVSKAVDNVCDVDDRVMIIELLEKSHKDCLISVKTISGKYPQR